MEILLGFVFLAAYLAFCYFLVVSAKSMTRLHTRMDMWLREIAERPNWRRGGRHRL